MSWRGQISRNLKGASISLLSNLTHQCFYQKNYKDLKTHNPKLPILIREARNIEPQLWARFDVGVERHIRLEGLSEEQISKALEDVVKVGAALKS